MLPSPPQDKILQSMGRGQGITVTNDGATILKSIFIDNPAAKVLVGEYSLPSEPTASLPIQDLADPMTPPCFCARWSSNAPQNRRCMPM